MFDKAKSDWRLSGSLFSLFEYISYDRCGNNLLFLISDGGVFSYRCGQDCDKNTVSCCGRALPAWLEA